MGHFILIVDDDAVTREALTHIFTRAGYLVAASDGGQDLGATMANLHFQAAVVDYHLPGTTGLVVARRLKELQPWCKVLIISAEFPLEAWEAAGANEADAFLTKPFSKDTILAELAKLVAAGQT